MKVGVFVNERSNRLSLVEPSAHRDLMLTKLQIPQQYEGLMERQRLLMEFDRVLKPGISWIIAPAGFGKTISAAAWLRNRNFHSGWVTLDQGDNELASFWDYLLKAFENCGCHISSKIVAQIQDSITQTQNNIRLLTHELKKYAYPITLVLDDIHHIREPQIFQVLRYLAKDLEKCSFHLILIGRQIPGTWLRSNPFDTFGGKITSLTLQFSYDEISQFADQHHLSLKPHQIETICRKTSGWPITLAIAFRSMQYSYDPLNLMELFQGSHDELAEFLSEEIFHRWDDDIQNFLLKTSILDRMTGPLCNAVVERRNSRRILEQLSHENNLIITLNRKKGWYRYQPLLASFLKHRLIQESKDEVRLLYQKAARYYQQQGVMNQAVRFFMKAKDYREATGIIEQISPKMFETRQHQLILRKWIRHLPTEILNTHLLLQLADGWISLINHQFDQTANCIENVRKQIDTEKNDKMLIGKNSQAENELYFLQANYALMTDQFETAVHWMKAAAKQPGVQTVYLGAQKALFLPVKEHSLLAGRMGFYGNLSLLKPAFEWFLNRLPDCDPSASCGLWILKAEIHYEQNELQEATTLLLQGLSEAELKKMWEFYVPGLILLALLMTARGSIREAHKMVDQAQLLLENDGLNEHTCQLEALRIRLKLIQGLSKDTEVWMNDCGLSLCHNPNAEDYFRHGTHVRVKIHQQYFKEALLELEQLLIFSRNEKRLMQQVETLNLMAVCHYNQGDEQKAFHYLTLALTLAQSQGYCRVFVDEGTHLYPVLKAFIQQNKHLMEDSAAMLEYAQFILILTRKHLHILGKASSISTVSPSGTLIESLTKRESQVLQLMASDLSNKEIGEKLSIKQSTIKVHTKNIYGKLMVSNRNEAIQVARKHDLIK